MVHEIRLKVGVVSQIEVRNFKQTNELLTWRIFGEALASVVGGTRHKD